MKVKYIVVMARYTEEYIIFCDGPQKYSNPAVCAPSSLLITQTHVKQQLNKFATRFKSNMNSC